MPLKARQSIRIVCGSFRLTERTGTYDADDNPTGYGEENGYMGDVTPYTAAFFAPKTTDPVYTLDLLDDTPDPDDDGHYHYVVTLADMGYPSDVLDPPSGLWRIVVTHGEDTIEFTCPATGDIERLIRKCICCGGKKHVWLDHELRAALHLYGCGKKEEFQTEIDQLYHAAKKCCDCGCQ